MFATRGGSYSTSSGTSAQCVADDAPPQRRRMTRRDDSRAPAAPEAAWDERRRRDIAKGDGNEKLVHDGGRASGEVVKSSKFDQCCSYDVTWGALEIQTAERDDKPDITVTSSGSFPCLHIALSGLKEDLSYYLAIELVEVRSGAGDMFSPMEYSDPYYIPRQNHLKGEQWMKKPRYYNLSAIVNGWLETYNCVLKDCGEYVPTVRLLEHPESTSALSQDVIRFELHASAFIISSDMTNRRNGSSPMKRRILLRLKSDTTTVREASRNESTSRSPESSEKLSDSQPLPTSTEKRANRSPSPPTLPYSQRLATSMEKMADRSPSPATLPDSRCLPTSTEKMANRWHSPATLSDSWHMSTSMVVNMTNRSPPLATLSDGWRMFTSMVNLASALTPLSPAGNRKSSHYASQLASALKTHVFPQTPVRVLLPEMVPAWFPRYSSTSQQWLSAPQANQQANAYRQSSSPRELCRICQRAWTMGCPICPMCQASRRNL
ncbi:uncharacterized protein [Dermacentor andersoni]|uniref:uncharacterized protein isoform X2 n=1 Tax=Dermacentor andersoni TaxID=34620 RepID=UPI002416730B|nr:uncharacterized protein LOC126518533 isoform X2 [Dermacentor andersoni]